MGFLFLVLCNQVIINLLIRLERTAPQATQQKRFSLRRLGFRWQENPPRRVEMVKRLLTTRNLAGGPMTLPKEGQSLRLRKN